MDKQQIVSFINENMFGIWFLIGAALVFWMQAGFAMVETGFTRAKNAGNILMKNLMDFSLGTPIFWILGFGIMFGAASPFFGGFDFFADGVVGEGYNWTTLIFQTVFCATAATIRSVCASTMSPSLATSQ